MKILTFLFSIAVYRVAPLKARFEIRTQRNEQLEFSMDYLTPMKGDTNNSEVLSHVMYIPASKLLEIESKPAENDGDNDIVFVEYTDELPITYYKPVFKEAYFSRKLIVLCQQTNKLELPEDLKTKASSHSKEILLVQSSIWLYSNHANFAYLEGKNCTLVFDKIFDKKAEIAKKELPGDLNIVNRIVLSKDLNITLLANLNIWKIIETLYDTLKDYSSFTNQFKLNIVFLVLPKSEQPNGKLFSAYSNTDTLSEYQTVNLSNSNQNGELRNFLVARLNEGKGNINALIYTDLMKLQFCYYSSKSIEFTEYLNLLLEINRKCFSEEAPSITCVLDLIKVETLKNCAKNMTDEDIRNKLYLNSASNSIGIDTDIQTSFYGYKINSHTNLDPDDNEFSSKKDFEIIRDICKMALAPQDKNIPNICRYDYCTDGFKYSTLLGKCVNVNNVDQERVLSMFNLLLLITIMALIVSVSFIIRKIIKQQKRIGKINRSYSRLFGNKFDKIIEDKSYIKE